MLDGSAADSLPGLRCFLRDGLQRLLDAAIGDLRQRDFSEQRIQIVQDRSVARGRNRSERFTFSVRAVIQPGCGSNFERDSLLRLVGDCVAVDGERIENLRLAFLAFVFVQVAGCIRISRADENVWPGSITFVVADVELAAFLQIVPL